LGNALEPSAEPLAALDDEWRQARAIAKRPKMPRVKDVVRLEITRTISYTGPAML
jgi:hypothetical protein